MKSVEGTVAMRESPAMKDLVLLLSRERDEQEITPVQVPGLGVYYTIAGFQIQAGSVLKHYSEAFLEVKRYVSFPSCSTCGSTSLRLEVLCPSCRQSDLLRIDLVVHYECGYMDGVEGFVRDSQGLLEKCPKCGKSLKRVGIDYGRPGLGFKCQLCGVIFQYPLTILRCDKDHLTTLDKISVERYPVFTLSKDLQKARTILGLLEKIRAELERGLNVEVEILKVIKGRSKMAHVVHALIRSDGKVAAIEILDEGSDISEAMGVVSKAVDLGMHFIVILDQKKASELRKVLNPDYFTLIPMRERGLESIRDLLLESVYTFVLGKKV
ncbi:hypothetical protein HRbin02_01573 [Candidatus Calditenuaceae archaeon HR02]|nr:hypothetical protein HRbin02_01573 [Candidatus Calditenuaceae archaeon HR02]